MGDYLQAASRLGRRQTARQAGDDQAEANKQAAHAGYYTPELLAILRYIAGRLFHWPERGDGRLAFLVDFQEHIETGNFHGTGTNLFGLNSFKLGDLYVPVLIPLCNSSSLTPSERARNLLKTFMKVRKPALLINGTSLRSNRT